MACTDPHGWNLPAICQFDRKVFKDTLEWREAVREESCLRAYTDIGPFSIYVAGPFNPVNNNGHRVVAEDMTAVAEAEAEMAVWL